MGRRRSYKISLPLVADLVRLSGGNISLFLKVKDRICDLIDLDNLRSLDDLLWFLNESFGCNEYVLEKLGFILERALYYDDYCDYFSASDRNKYLDNRLGLINYLGQIDCIIDENKGFNTNTKWLSMMHAISSLIIASDDKSLEKTIKLIDMLESGRLTKEQLTTISEFNLPILSALAVIVNCGTKVDDLKLFDEGMFRTENIRSAATYCLNNYIKHLPSTKKAEDDYWQKNIMFHTIANTKSLTKHL